MKPVDPRLLRQAAAARTFLALQVLFGLVTAVLVIAQATLVVDLLVGTFLDGRGLAGQRGALLSLGGVLVARALLTWAAETCAHLGAASVRGQLRHAVLAHAGRLGPAWLAGQPTGEFVVLTTRGLDALDDYFSRYLPQLVLACCVPFLVAARIAAADLTSLVIVVCTLPLVPVFMVLIGLGTREQMDKQWNTLSRLGHHFLDVVAGLPTLRIFGRAHAQVETVGRVCEQLRRTTMKTLRVAFLSSLALELISSLSVALVAVSVGLRLVNGGVSLRTALLALVLAPEVYLPWRRVGAAYHASVEGVSAVAGALEVLETPVPRAGVLPAPDLRRHAIRIEDLSVRYAGRALPAVRGVDLVIEPGETVAVIGPSGCGKSTLLAALLGFVTPDAGRIVVGDTDLCELDPQSWRRQLAWVGQRPHLFATSVADNIRLGRSDAEDEQVRAAARMAGADTFIDELPDGYATVLGERGFGLSVGQRQRIAIARAFLTDAPLLVLDEPTAALDTETEAHIVDALRALTRGRTVILTSHRPALFTRADRVVHLDLLAAGAA